VKRFIANWTINTLAVLVAVNTVKGIHYDRFLDLLCASLLLGILNAVLRPILFLLTLPLVILTLGLFRFVINALVLYSIGYLMRPRFYVDGLWGAFWGALVISIIATILHLMTGTGNARVKIQSQSRPKRDREDGGGPVIDV
jgi:putative membrane protein